MLRLEGWKVAETPNAILANQYHNPENPRSHLQTTGPEIWQLGRVPEDWILSPTRFEP